MSWRIDRHYGARDGEPTNVGRGQYDENNPPTMPYRFRLRDDDGEIYYGGGYDAAAVAEDGGESDTYGSLYLAWRWGEYDSGATDLQVKADDYLALTGPSEHVTGDRDGWYSVFG